MIYPEFLKNGDVIGVPAPSSGAYDVQHINKYKNAKKKLEQMGYSVEWSKNIFKSDMARSADAKYRAKELTDMFENKDINFLMCAAGGEFLVELLPYVDFEKIKEHPKYILGMSDPTGILFPITTKYDIATIYGLNFGDYGTEEYTRDITDNLQIITGKNVVQENYEMYEKESAPKVTGLEGYNYTDKVIWKNLNRDRVEVTGRIIGGCLDLIDILAGTKYDGTQSFINRYKDDGIIWYFDNCDFSKEDVIRTLWKFNELGYFKFSKAVIFGRNGNDSTLLGYTMEQALKDSVLSEFDIPVVYDADISHRGPCFTIINGAIATIKSENGKGNISFELK